MQIMQQKLFRNTNALTDIGTEKRKGFPTDMLNSVHESCENEAIAYQTAVSYTLWGQIVMIEGG